MITQDEHMNNLIVNAAGRESEIYAYQLNIDMYNATVATLPKGEWPEHITAYKATPIDNLPLSLSGEDVELIMDYQHRDRLLVLLRTELNELKKVTAMRDILKNQIGDNYLELVRAAREAQAQAMLAARAAQAVQAPAQ